MVKEKESASLSLKARVSPVTGVSIVSFFVLVFLTGVCFFKQVTVKTKITASSYHYPRSRGKIRDRNRHSENRRK